ncbi:hypothetical protein LWI28_006059 [Acer negundo]|uniref:Glycosyltransferase N-terminal domain-containing protein n=1 Tax=Acer negundo TaxID=4023 RepID=A0AAD5IIK7_ACENE|nr:hypothetical protein LWI28_006059 [Acer negundo]
MCSSPHIVAIPFPAQGHVIPLLELSQCLVKHGCRVTFVNTDYNHKRVVNALEENNCIGDQIHLVSVPDGMEPWEDRNDLGKLSESMLKTMPGKLKVLIEKINNQGNEVACVIGDGSIGWVMELAKKMNIRRAAFWPAATALLALTFSIPKLIDDGIINNDGTVIKKGMVQLAPNMPATNSANLVWACLGDFSVQKVIFDLMVNNTESLKIAEIMVCNSTYELEPAAFSFVPEILPVVLGVQWLETLGPVETDYWQLTMSFREGETKRTLHGIRQPGLAALTDKEFQHLHGTGLFLQMVAVNDHCTSTKHPPALREIPNEFTQVFEPPTSLPPSRTHDH